MLKFIRFAAAIAVAVITTGCASVPMASPEADAAAKTFTVNPTKANVYIYRNESMGAAIEMPVTVNGSEVGKTAANTFIFLTLDPGTYQVVSKTENDSTVVLNAQAGQNYFLWQEVKMGTWSAGSHLQEVAEHVGKAGVNECSMIQNY